MKRAATRGVEVLIVECQVADLDDFRIKAHGSQVDQGMGGKPIE